ncbi:hypothetical protein, partial [Serratia marcescens]|uniref:hypothetical protein n=1 Tax=Serratia marcescens TaxID=615 RepID=UPI001953114F
PRPERARIAGQGARWSAAWRRPAALPTVDEPEAGIKECSQRLRSRSGQNEASSFPLHSAR